MRFLGQLAATVIGSAAVVRRKNNESRKNSRDNKSH